MKKTFSKGDTTNWCYKLHKITETKKDAVPSLKKDNLPERFNEAILKSTQLTLKEIDSVIKKLNII